MTDKNCCKKICALAFSPSPSALLLLLGLASAAILGAAIVSQVFFHYPPCELCWYQRYPYMAVIALSAASFFIKNRHILILMGIAAALLLAVDAGIAAYHTGVEMGIFKGPDACSGGSSAGLTIEEMRRQIMEAPLVSCGQATFMFLGLSMAAWNAIAASILCLWAVYALIRMRPSRHAKA